MSEREAPLWLDTIRFEMDAIPDEDVLPPPDDLEENERLLGILTDQRVRRIFTLSRLVAYKAAKVGLDRQFASKLGGKIVGDVPTSAEHAQMTAKAEALNNLFWIEVRESMRTEIGDVDCIAIRKDWQLVESVPDEPRGGMKGILGLFGNER